MNNVTAKKINRIITVLLSKASIKSPPVDVEKITKIYKITIRKIPYDGKDILSGVLIRDIGKNIIGVNANHSLQRQRFTIAHEIAHFLLHEGDKVFIDKAYRLNYRTNSQNEKGDAMEAEANKFAGKILIPTEFLLKDLMEMNIDILETDDIQKLAKRYNVSEEAMSLRLGEI